LVAAFYRKDPNGGNDYSTVSVILYRTLILSISGRVWTFTDKHWLHRIPIGPILPAYTSSKHGMPGVLFFWASVKMAFT